MSVIKSVSVCVARVPLAVPVSFSTRTVTAREYCLVKVESVDGKIGVGYCYAVNRAGRILALSILDLLGPNLIGQDSLRIEGLWAEMYQDALLLGRSGAVMRALSAVDTALWDLNARSANLPLYKYLGANSTTTVPAYASGGYYMKDKTVTDLQNEMAQYVADGFKAIKIKVGLAPVKEEEKRLAAVREVIGDEIRLMLDANNAWKDYPTALEYARCFERFSPYWLEEPFSPDDIDNHARLAQATRIPIATGEVEAGRWRFKDLMDRQAATILQTDATVCGGITEWRRIAATAASYGLNVEPHAWHDLHIHLVASTRNSMYVEWMPDDHIVNFRRLIDTQIKALDGNLLLPETPGLGFDFDEAAIAEYGQVFPRESSPWVQVR